MPRDLCSSCGEVELSAAREELGLCRICSPDSIKRGRHAAKIPGAAWTKYGVKCCTCGKYYADKAHLQGHRCDQFSTLESLVGLPAGCKCTAERMQKASAQLSALWQQRCAIVPPQCSCGDLPDSLPRLPPMCLYKGVCNKRQSPHYYIIATRLWRVQGADSLPGKSQLLFKGAPKSVVPSIMADGIKLGRKGLFGAGAYFCKQLCKASQFIRGADCFHWSGGCGPTRGHCHCNNGVLLVCAVAQGRQFVAPMVRKQKGNNRPSTKLSKSKKAPKGYSSVIGKGYCDPEHDEIIVYSSSRAQLKYIVEVEYVKCNR